MKTNTKFHAGIHVSDIDKSVDFYKDLFQKEPIKVKVDYAKFESDEIVLSLIKRPEQVRPDFGHFGLRVNDDSQLRSHHDRLKKGGHILDVEEKVDCCYAIQDKFWVKDPDGLAWEVYTFIEDTDKGIRPEIQDAEAACCGPDCC